MKLKVFRMINIVLVLMFVVMLLLLRWRVKPRLG